MTERSREYGSATEWWDEFLLYSPEQGYAWLIRENGHYTLLRPTKLRPSRDPFNAPQKTSIRVGDEYFQVYDYGTAVLDEAEGEITWIAKPGEQVKAVDCIDPPRIFTVEKSKEELEYFIGVYVDPKEVYEAFGLKETPPRPKGIYACQPFADSPALNQCKWWSALFCLVFAGLLFHACGSSGGPHILSQDLTTVPDLAGGVMTEPFTTTHPDTIVKVDVSAPVDNSWVWLGFDVFDEQDQDIAEFSTQVDYYYGTDSEGSWSEGSSNDSALIKIEEPGTYRLKVSAEGGSGDGEAGGPVAVSVNVRAQADYVPVRYYLVGFLLSFFIAGALWLKKSTFEAARWGQVIEDDDDDD